MADCKHSGVISSFSRLLFVVSLLLPFPLMEFSLEGGDVADELLLVVLLLDKIEETENMLGFFGTIGVVMVVIVSCNL